MGAAAIAETTGEQPRYQSFAEYRKSLSYSARRGSNRKLAEESQRQSRFTSGQKLPSTAALGAARSAGRAQISPSPKRTALAPPPLAGGYPVKRSVTPGPRLDEAGRELEPLLSS